MLTRGIKMPLLVTFIEHHYLGSDPNGRNTSNYADLIRWFRNCGLSVSEGIGEDDDVSILMLKMIPIYGVHTLIHRGMSLHYQAYDYHIKRDCEGYTTSIVYSHIFTKE